MKLLLARYRHVIDRASRSMRDWHACEIKQVRGPPFECSEQLRHGRRGRASRRQQPNGGDERRERKQRQQHLEFGRS